MTIRTLRIEAFPYWVWMLLLMFLSGCSEPRTTKIYISNSNFFYQEIHFLDNGTAISFLQDEGKLRRLESEVKKYEGEIVLSGPEHQFRYKYLHYKGRDILVPADVFTNAMEFGPKHRDRYLEESLYFIPSESGKYSVR